MLRLKGTFFIDKNEMFQSEKKMLNILGLKIQLLFRFLSEELNVQINPFLCFLQGEKAYSCSQCGTRFTYRNGLIKHTKLNRCPKRSITVDGETIVKKRSRNLSSKSKTSSGSLSIPVEPNGPPSGMLLGSSSPVEAVADIR